MPLTPQNAVNSTLTPEKENLTIVGQTGRLSGRRRLRLQSQFPLFEKVELVLWGRSGQNLEFSGWNTFEGQIAKASKTSIQWNLLTMIFEETRFKKGETSMLDYDLAAA